MCADWTLRELTEPKELSQNCKNWPISQKSDTFILWWYFTKSWIIVHYRWHGCHSQIKTGRDILSGFFVHSIDNKSVGYTDMYYLITIASTIHWKKAPENIAQGSGYHWSHQRKGEIIMLQGFHESCDLCSSYKVFLWALLCSLWLRKWSSIQKLTTQPQRLEGIDM